MLILVTIIGTSVYKYRLENDDDNETDTTSPLTPISPSMIADFKLHNEEQVKKFNLYPERLLVSPLIINTPSSALSGNQPTFIPMTPLAK